MMSPRDNLHNYRLISMFFNCENLLNLLCQKKESIEILIKFKLREDTHARYY